ncbi:MAG: hypothetical protein DRP46_11425 [Candidatus Zixiibacteriota bacterium]|nr:MAG: hypothetical protein DRP46_11425 [candidate division Zixibacteria bacterium]
MYTMNGCGTKLYGRTSTPDGYIATKWFCLVFIPVFPISSYLVISEAEDYDYIISSKKTYQMVKLDEIYRPHLQKFLISWAIAIALFVLLSYL